MTLPTGSQEHAAIAAVRETWVAAVAGRDAQRLRDLLADDYEVWAHGAEALSGPDAAVAAMAAALGRYRIEQAFDPV
jgi:ketosteroid isomerase-like protein